TAGLPDAGAFLPAFFGTMPGVNTVHADLVAGRFQPLQQFAFSADVVGSCPSFAVRTSHVFSRAPFKRNEEERGFRLAFEFKESIEILKPEIVTCAEINRR